MHVIHIGRKGFLIGKGRVLILGQMTILKNLLPIYMKYGMMHHYIVKIKKVNSIEE